MKSVRLLHVPSADWSWRQIRDSLAGRPSAGAVADIEAEGRVQLDLDVVAFGSCRAALAAVLKVLAPIGRVLTPAYTCVAVPNAIRTAGCPIEWFDVSGANIDLDAVERAARPGDVLLAQHTYGLPIDPGRLAAISRQGVVIVEDRAHRLDGRDVVGIASVYSLEHSKIASAGQGGLVASSDSSFLSSIRRLREHLPIPGTADVRRALLTSAVQVGLASIEPVFGPVASLLRRAARRVPYISIRSQTVDELSGGPVAIARIHPRAALVGRSSLAGLQQNLRHREALCQFYQAELGDLIPDWARVSLPLVRQPLTTMDAVSATHRLRQQGIDLGVRWFEAPIHPRGSRSSYVSGSAPRAELLASRVLSLPTHPRVSRDAAARIVRAVRVAAS